MSSESKSFGGGGAAGAPAPNDAPRAAGGRWAAGAATIVTTTGGPRGGGGGGGVIRLAARGCGARAREAIALALLCARRRECGPAATCGVTCVLRVAGHVRLESFLLSACSFIAPVRVWPRAQAAAASAAE